MLLFVPVRHLHPQPSHPRFSFAGPFKKKKTWKRSHFPVVNNCCFVCLDTFSYKNFKKKDSSNPNIPFKFSFLVCNDCVIDYTYLRRWRRLPAGKQSAWSIKRLLWEFINTPNNHWFTSSACTECRCFQTSLMEPSAPAWHFFCSKVSDHLGSFTLSGTFTQTNSLVVSGSYRVPWGSPSCERRGIWLHGSCVAYLQLLKITQWLKGCWQHS